MVEERNTVERRFTQQIEQLQNDLAVQWESNSKLQLELDKQRRENTEMRRELSQKQALVDDIRKDMQNKICKIISFIIIIYHHYHALHIYQIIHSFMIN